MKKILSPLINYLRRADLLLLLLCVFASAIGILALSSMAAEGGRITELSGTSYQRVGIQTGAAGLGVLSALLLARVDYHTAVKLWKIHLPLCVMLVLLTFTSLGHGVGDADDQAWMAMLGGIMTVQPTELLKISFILSFALHLSKVGAEINRPLNVLWLGLHGGLMIMLIHFQGDDGTALIFAVIFLFMMFVAGWSLWYLLAGLAAVAAASPLIWSVMMNNDQRARILALYQSSPESASVLYQQDRALIAIGSGQVVGTGLFSGDYSYVPSMRNDFIFSFIGNALGFVGCVTVILILAGICIRVLWTSHLSPDDTGRYICVGVFAMIASQAVINLGMNLRLLPVVGVTLPLFSEGGTSTLGIYLGVGMVMSVYAHSRRNLFLN